MAWLSTVFMIKNYFCIKLYPFVLMPNLDIKFNICYTILVRYNYCGGKMIILGLDPGFATIGYGVINSERGKATVIDYGTVTTPKELSFPERLLMIEKGVAQLIEKFKPDNIAIEELFFNTNITTGINVAHARGVMLLVCARECGGNLFEYTPLQIKQALTGYGRATKPQMMQMVKTLLRLEKIPRPDDAADALAVALCHSQTNRFGKMFKI